MSMQNLHICMFYCKKNKGLVHLKQHGTFLQVTCPVPLPLVRNAGNLVPHANLSGHEEITTEPAALELGCVINGIKHVIVCGHSDCKVCMLS